MLMIVHLLLLAHACICVGSLVKSPLYWKNSSRHWVMRYVSWLCLFYLRRHTTRSTSCQFCVTNMTKFRCQLAVFRRPLCKYTRETYTDPGWCVAPHSCANVAEWCQAYVRADCFQVFILYLKLPLQKCPLQRSVTCWTASLSTSLLYTFSG